MPLSNNPPSPPPPRPSPPLPRGLSDLSHLTPIPLLPPSPSQPALLNTTSTNNTSLSLRMFLGLIILDQQLPTLPIAARLIVRDLHDREPACCAFGFAEDAVHFFEGAVGGFRVEEVGYGDYEGVAG